MKINKTFRLTHWTSKAQEQVINTSPGNPSRKMETCLLTLIQDHFLWSNILQFLFPVSLVFYCCHSKLPLDGHLLSLSSICQKSDNNTVGFWQDQTISGLGSSMEPLGGTHFQDSWEHWHNSAPCCCGAGAPSHLVITVLSFYKLATFIGSWHLQSSNPLAINQDLSML